MLLFVQTKKLQLNYTMNKVTMGIHIISIASVAALSFFLILYASCLAPTKLSASCSLPINSLSTKDVLGAQTIAIDLSKLEKERSYWKQIIKAHPDYEDAYVQLIVLSYKTKNSDDLSEYLTLLQEKNPNNTLLPSLKKLQDAAKK